MLKRIICANLNFFIFVLAFASASFGAGETLFSNWSMAVAKGNSVGELWVFSRGETNQGIALLQLGLDGNGKVKIENASVEPIDNDVSFVHANIYADKLAEKRRFSTELGGDLGIVIPMFGLDANDYFLEPLGFFSVKHVGVIDNTPLVIPSSAESLENTTDYAVSGFAYSDSKKKLYIARGSLGIVEYDITKGAGNPLITNKLLNKLSYQLEILKNSDNVDFSKYLDIWDISIDPNTQDLYMATQQGLWIKKENGSVINASKTLENKRVTGVWIGGSPLEIIVETSALNKGVLEGSLWRKKLSEKSDFKKVVFLDSLEKIQKKDIYDNMDYTTTNVVFVGDKIFVGVWVAGGSISGYLEINSKGVLPHNKQNASDKWLNNFETGVTDRDAIVTSITDFHLTNNTIGLALATDGNGISVSADTGKTWTPILNRAKLSGNLGSIRMVPSVITAGGQSLVSYKVSKDSKITIEVFSYDMRRVRKIVSSAPRYADASRSTNAIEDVWDGLDDAGRPCSMGIYYVRVKDNHGHIGWGKVMTLGGEK